MPNDAAFSRERQREREARALARLRFGAEVAAVHGGDHALVDARDIEDVGDQSAEAQHRAGRRVGVARALRALFAAKALWFQFSTRRLQRLRKTCSMNPLHRVPKKGLKTTEMAAEQVRDFNLVGTGGMRFTLSSLRGTKHVPYFYPKDSTPGCSAEGSDFRDLHGEFLRAGRRFKQKMRFPFELPSDPEEAVCRQFGVMKDKTMYGKKVRGIPKGLRGVKVPGHAQEVLNFVKAL